MEELQPSLTDIGYIDGKSTCAHSYVLPAVFGILEAMKANGKTKVFDLGCGNGSTAAELAKRGFQVVGVDPSDTGVREAKRAHPQLSIESGSAYDDLAKRFGRFPAVISLEVVEHVYSPKRFARTLADLVEPGGIAIVSTPYHGYWKNLALALTGQWDTHFTALWENGHIKFWSRQTLTTLLKEAGLKVVDCHRVGRIPPLAKSMILVARKPMEI